MLKSQTWQKFVISDSLKIREPLRLFLMHFFSLSILLIEIVWTYTENSYHILIQSKCSPSSYLIVLISDIMIRYNFFDISCRLFWHWRLDILALLNFSENLKYRQKWNYARNSYLFNKQGAFCGFKSRSKSISFWIINYIWDFSLWQKLSSKFSKS